MSSIREGMIKTTSIDVILAIDIGTGSSRAMVVDTGLNKLSIHQISYDLYKPRSGWVEQNADEVLRATLQVIKQAAASAKMAGLKIAGLCFSSAVSSLLAVDAGGKPLGNALTWADLRAVNEVIELKEEARELYRRTGTHLHTGYWLPKLRWFQTNRPDIMDDAAYWMGIKDYVIRHLSGELMTDCSNAAATGMLNLQTLHWDEMACSYANLNAGTFLPIQPTTFTIPKIRAEIASELGLPALTALILGAGDGALANLGSGSINPGQAATTIGSSGACRSVASTPVLHDERMRLWSYPLLEELWVIGGAENSGGLVVDWFHKNMTPATDDNFAEMLQASAVAPAGSNGLIFLPYLFGERAPIWDATARGAFIGLDNKHTPAHLMRALLEGTVFALYDVYQALCDTIAPITEIRVSGGYTRSPFWLSLQASMFGKELVVMEDHECSAIGAALLGFLALGIFPDLNSGVSKLRIKEIIQPDPRQTEQYQKILPLYTSAFQQLRPIFEELQHFRLEKSN